MADSLHVPNLVLIGSFGRNDGKTTLACALIEQLKAQAPVVGLKVIRVERPDEPCHRGEKGCGLCGGLCGEYDITEEDGGHPGKDTAKMLAAGARGAFLLRSRPESLRKALEAFLGQVPGNALVVCESNSLREVVRPGVFLMASAQSSPEGPVKPSAQRVAHLADKIVVRGQPVPRIYVDKTPEGVLYVHLEHEI